MCVYDTIRYVNAKQTKTHRPAAIPRFLEPFHTRSSQSTGTCHGPLLQPPSRKYVLWKPPLCDRPSSMADRPSASTAPSAEIHLRCTSEKQFREKRLMRNVACVRCRRMDRPRICRVSFLSFLPKTRLPSMARESHGKKKAKRERRRSLKSDLSPFRRGPRKNWITPERGSRQMAWMRAKNLPADELCERRLRSTCLRYAAFVFQGSGRHSYQ